MSREEYMKQLAYLLQDIPEEERREALEYYEDYFEEAGAGQEYSVIEMLGSPEKVVALIKEGLVGENSDMVEYTEAGYRDDRFDEFRKVPKPQDTFNRENTEETHGEEIKKKRQSTVKIIMGIVLIICVLELVIKIIGSVLGGVVGLTGGIISLVFGGIAAVFGTLGGGVVLLIRGIMQLGTATGTAFLSIGVGLLTLALGGILFIIWFNILFRLIPWLVKGVIKIFNKLFRKGVRQA